MESHLGTMWEVLLSQSSNVMTVWQLRDGQVLTVIFYMKAIALVAWLSCRLLGPHLWPRGTTDYTQRPQTCSIYLSTASNRIHRGLRSLSKDLVLCAELSFLADLLFRHASFPSKHRNAATPLLGMACILAGDTLLGS